MRKQSADVISTHTSLAKLARASTPWTHFTIHFDINHHKTPPSSRRCRKKHGEDTSKQQQLKHLISSTMASDLVNINNPRDWGHHKSPFFKLPPEIRNKIYRETFTGSDIALVLDPPMNVNVVPVTGRRSVFVNVGSANHFFLLTCVQVYLEALAIVSTILRLP